MPYTKIKYNKGTTTLTRVEDRSASDVVEQTLTSHDDPRPEFVNALQALTSWVVRICELPLNYADDMRITGISLSLGDYGGCVVTALKKVSGANAPVVINTPHVPETPTSDAGPCLPSTTIALIHTLEEEAERFWKGERAQEEMFSDATSNQPGGIEITEPYRPDDGITATVSVNGGPAIDLRDESAVMDALAPVVEQAMGMLRRGGDA